MSGRSGAPLRQKDEAERPYWISFSDMMSALMVLFLIAMSVALLAVTDEISTTEQKKTEREDDIRSILQRLQEISRDFPGITVHGHSIDFGDRARFDTNSHRLSSEQAHTLRSFTPRLLGLVRDPLTARWLKRVVVEGFADARGSYIHNLNLSLQRSERVLCVLLAPPAAAADALLEADRLMVRELFFVGGASFNSLKGSAEESRRIELRLEFLDPGEAPASFPRPPLDDDARCPLDRP